MDSLSLISHGGKHEIATSQHFSPEHRVVWMMLSNLGDLRNFNEELVV